MASELAPPARRGAGGAIYATVWGRTEGLFRIFVFWEFDGNEVRFLSR